jgi:HSP20 family protein
MSTQNDIAVIRQDNTALMKKAEPVVPVTPLVDIYETPDAYVLMVDLPGASKESIRITLDQTSLVVKASVESHVANESKFLGNEIPNAGFHRAFNLTDGIDQDNVDARYEDGVLKLKLLKKEELKPREITIK